MGGDEMTWPPATGVVQKHTHIPDDAFFSHAELFSTSSRSATEKPSYASTVRGFTSPSAEVVSVESITTNKGGFIAVKINQEMYEQQLALCKHALIARIVLSKGDSPWKLF